MGDLTVHVPGRVVSRLDLVVISTGPVIVIWGLKNDRKQILYVNFFAQIYFESNMGLSTSYPPVFDVNKQRDCDMIANRTHKKKVADRFQKGMFISQSGQDDL